MIVIGLTGGIAMGKSEVARILRAEGVPVFDADKEVHRLYDSPEGGGLVKPIAPTAIMDGKVDRTQLSRLLLEDPGLLKKLEAIVHAEIRKRRQHFLDTQRREGRGLVALDIPLLFETGAEKDVDVTVVVSAQPAIQHERAMARPGMTEEKLAMVLKRQMPDAEKRARAGHVIETNGTLDELHGRVHDVLRQIRKEHAL